MTENVFEWPQSKEDIEWEIITFFKEKNIIRFGIKSKSII